MLLTNIADVLEFRRWNLRRLYGDGDPSSYPYPNELLDEGPPILLAYVLQLLIVEGDNVAKVGVGESIGFVRVVFFFVWSKKLTRETTRRLCSRKNGAKCSSIIWRLSATCSPRPQSSPTPPLLYG